jgi:hypothetical protein
MVNKKILGMLAMVLALGMALAGCDDGSDDGSNPFIGNWAGTVTMSNQTGQGTITVTSSSWNISVPIASFNGAGTYTYNDNVATLKDEARDTIGTATISGNGLIVSINSGPYAGFYGTFYK